MSESSSKLPCIRALLELLLFYWKKTTKENLRAQTYLEYFKCHVDWISEL